MKFRTLLVLGAVSAATMVSLTSCVGLVVGGAVMGAGTAVSTAADRRSSGAVVNDSVLETRIGGAVSTALQGTDCHVSVVSYNGRVLLAGEVATEAARSQAEQAARSFFETKEVLNELAVMPSAGLSQRMSDTTLVTKVRSAIIATKEISLNQMKIDTERGIVYIMGLLTAQENRTVCAVAARVSGVRRVVSYAEILTREEISRRMQGFQSPEAPGEPQEDPSVCSTAEGEPL